MSFTYAGLKKKFPTENYTTTDSWTQARDFDVDGLKSKTIIITNTDATNDILVKVNGSVDDGSNYDIPIQAEVTLSPNQVLALNMGDAYTNIEVQTKSAVAGNAGVCTTRGYALGA